MKTYFPERKAPRLPAAVLLVASTLLLLLFVADSAALAQEEQEQRQKEETMRHEDRIRQQSSGEDVSANGWTVSDGTVVSDDGDIRVGDGCVKAGSITVGDCDGDGGGEEPAGETTEDDPPTEDDSPADEQYEGDEDASGEDASPEETAPEQTTPEMTLPESDEPEETTPEETSPEEDTTEDDEAAGQCPAEPSTETVEATVERVVDGDTFELSEEVEGADTVRLIGVDTPEMEGEDGDPEAFAEEAGDFTASAVEGETVLLEVGEEPQDDYGRLLAYVWSEDASEMLNLTLLEEGLAEVLTIEPNDAYAECFEQASEEAEQSGEGMHTEVAPRDGEDGSESTPPEDTTSEDTTSEDTTSEDTTSEDTTSEDGAEEDTPSGEDPADEQYSDEGAPPEETTPEEDPLTLAELDPEMCPDPRLIETLSGGEGEEPQETSFSIEDESLALSYATGPIDGAAEDAGAVILTLTDGNSQPVGQPLVAREAGARQAYISPGAGSYNLSLESAARAWKLEVHECAASERDRQPEQEQTPPPASEGGPEGASEGAPEGNPQDTPVSDPESGEAPQVSSEPPEAAPPAEPEEASPPQSETLVPAGRPEEEAFGMEPAPQETLPTAPSGDVPVLPDTGGGDYLLLALGCVMTCSGVFLFVCLRLAERRVRRRERL